MPVGLGEALLSLPASRKTIPIVESRTQFVRALETAHVRAVFLRHCNLFEILQLLEQVRQRMLFTYVNIDHLEGIHDDSAGVRYLAEHLGVTGIISTHSRILAVGKSFGLETIQRIFALDSTGLETALETVDLTSVDLFDISPALVVPHIAIQLHAILPRPFLASGLVQTREQVQAIQRAGALGVAVTHSELWV